MALLGHLLGFLLFLVMSKKVDEATPQTPLFSSPVHLLARQLWKEQIGEYSWGQGSSWLQSTPL